MGVFARFLARKSVPGASLLILGLATWWGFAQLPDSPRVAEPNRAATIPLPPAAPPRAPAVWPSIPVVAAAPLVVPAPALPAALPQVSTPASSSPPVATDRLGATSRLDATGGVAPVAPAPPAGGPDQPPPPGSGTPEQRLRALEQQNAELLRQLSGMAQRQQAMATRLSQLPAQEAPLNYNTPGQFGRPRQPGADVVQTPEEELPRARVDLSQGVRFLSPDGNYRIEFHDMTQFEGRFFGQTGSTPADLHDNFDIPRQRLYFTGQVDKYFDFYSVLNRGYGSLDLLDSFVNFKFDKTFNVRVGRTKTPYTYEYYKIAEGDLIAPERSVFVGNLAPNRQIGAMAFGRLLEEQVEYAVGVFNGPHRSFQDFNNFKNPFVFVNTKPFLYGGSDLLRQLNVGGSVNFGREDDPLEPNALHTANDETVTDSVFNVSPTFLRFSNAAVEKGGTAFWSGDVTWYYRSMTALANYNGGYITYALPARSGIRVPYEGGSVALTYFITGEEIVTRKEVEPLRPFSIRNPFDNPGGIELYARAAYLNAGANVFSSGLADPRLWSNDALVIDAGFNWYLNRFVRVFVDWQNAQFGSPVQVGPNRFTHSTNMFWLRTQLYY